MIFAKLPIRDCEGALLVHAQLCGKAMLRKGHRLSAEDIATLAAAGIAELAVARLEAEDIGEDEAAAAIAAPLAGPNLTLRAPFTGRVNIFAARAGLFLPAATIIDRLNAIDEAITLATLPAFVPVGPGDMVATVKIIPFAVPRAALDRARQLLAESEPAFVLRPFRARSVHLVQTRLPGLKPALLDKTEQVMRDRLAKLGQGDMTTSRIDHDESELAAHLRQIAAEIVLVMGASAIADRRDVIPAAILAAGGRIEQFGMPVDPGNLMLLGAIGDRWVIGLPGCARSPLPNGCDWVMARLCADLAVESADIRRMGVGGLLPEIALRPMPRAASAPGSPKEKAPRIAAIILAAGAATRMGEDKLRLDFGGKPILAHVVDAALAAGFAEVVVVLGPKGMALREALGARKLRYVEAPSAAFGMAESLKAGIASLPEGTDAAMILLGDMPLVSTALLKRLAKAFDPESGRAIVLPIAEGKRGHPVLFAERFFPEIATLAGDIGARPILAAHADLVAEIPAAAAEIFTDIDSPEAYRALRERSA